jgi:hypothetical protein
MFTGRISLCATWSGSGIPGDRFEHLASARRHRSIGRLSCRGSRPTLNSAPIRRIDALRFFCLSAAVQFAFLELTRFRRSFGGSALPQVHGLFAADRGFRHPSPFVVPFLCGDRTEGYGRSRRPLPKEGCHRHSWLPTKGVRQAKHGLADVGASAWAKALGDGSASCSRAVDRIRRCHLRRRGRPYP